MTAATDPERELLQAALRGNAAAAANLTRSLSDLVWTVCLHVSQDKPSAEAAFRDVMTALKADNFARLKGFDGRARFRVYAVLVVRDLETTVLVGVLGFRRRRLRHAFAQAGIALRERWAWSVPVSSLYRRSERRHLS